MHVLIPDKLEELLLKSWSLFIDKSKLFSFVIRSVRDHGSFNRIEQEELPGTSLEMTISRFCPCEAGFEISVEFRIPSKEGLMVGTSELYLSLNGNLGHVRTLGVIFR